MCTVYTGVRFTAACRMYALCRGTCLISSERSFSLDGSKAVSASPILRLDELDVVVQLQSPHELLVGFRPREERQAVAARLEVRQALVVPLQDGRGIATDDQLDSEHLSVLFKAFWPHQHERNSWTREESRVSASVSVRADVSPHAVLCIWILRLEVSLEL